MKKEEISQSICDIYNALNTLSVKGYNDCKTYSNCMELLNKLVSEIMNLQVLEETKK